jgi:hypothetical protein
VLKRISGWLRGDAKQQLCDMLSDGRKVRVEYLPYDWSTNAEPEGAVYGGGAKGDRQRACVIS